MFFLRFLAFSNVLISLVAGALTFGFATHLKSEKAFLYGVVVFGATLFTYNLHRIMRLREIQPNYSIRQQWLLKHPFVIYVLGSIGLLIGVFVYFVHFYSLYSILILGFVGIISTTYAFKTKVDRKSLRELPYIKIYLIGISWTLVCFVWPILQEQLLVADYWSILFAGFLYIFSATIPFDIRDADYDSPSQKTIPHLVGEKYSKMIAVLTLLLSFGFIAIYSVDALSNLPLLIAYLGMLLLIVFTKQKNQELYFSFLIDGWIVFLGWGIYAMG